MIPRLAVLLSLVALAAPPAPAAAEEEPDRGIFVPPARGAGETLDEEATAARGAAEDEVRTARGDLLKGRVLGLDEKALRLTSGTFTGEVVVRRDALERVEFAGAEAPATLDLVRLVNGDVFRGELASIDEESLVLRSPAAGEVRVARDMVAGLRLATKSGELLETDFSDGRLGPWSAQSGTWALEEGTLRLKVPNGISQISAPVKQDGPMTMEVVVRAGPHGLPYAALVLSADDSTPQFGRGSVYGIWSGNSCYVGYSDENRRSRNIQNRNYEYRHEPGKEVRLRMAFDPREKVVRCWYDDQMTIEAAVPVDLGDGKFVMFLSQQPLDVLSVRVRRGIVEGASGGREEKFEGIRLVFANDDQITATGVRLVDGEFEVTTAHGVLTFPPDRLARIDFGGATDAPAAREGDVVVRTTADRITMRVDVLDGESLRGSSPIAGDLKVDRRMLAAIEFTGKTKGER